MDLEEPAPNSTQQMLFLLGRIDGKLDGLSGQFKRHVEDDLLVAQRVDSLEKSRAWSLGVGSVLIMLWAIFSEKVKLLF